MRVVSFSSRRGGVGKTTCSHLLAWGASGLQKPMVESVLLHTDQREPPSIERAYALMDCRSANAIEQTANQILNSGIDGLMVIDGAGNRENIDLYLAPNSDLMLIPFRLDRESIDVSLAHYDSLKASGASEVRFILTGAPSTASMSEYDNELLDSIPSDKVLAHVPQVRASRQLLDSDPADGMRKVPTPVNNAARLLYRSVRDLLA